MMDFAAVEQALNVKLPDYYRKLIQTKGAELKNRTTAFWGDADSYEYLFLTAQAMITHNQFAKKDGDLPEAARGWWQKYVIVGTNGAGGYFAIRLDGQPGIWYFGNDDGDEITKNYESFEQILDEQLSDYEDEQ